jgi:hypothetical protein
LRSCTLEIVNICVPPLESFLPCPRDHLTCKKRINQSDVVKSPDYILQRPPHDNFTDFIPIIHVLHTKFLLDIPIVFRLLTLGLDALPHSDSQFYMSFLLLTTDISSRNLFQSRNKIFMILALPTKIESLVQT